MPHRGFWLLWSLTYILFSYMFNLYRTNLVLACRKTTGEHRMESQGIINSVYMLLLDKGWKLEAAGMPAEGGLPKAATSL